MTILANRFIIISSLLRLILHLNLDSVLICNNFHLKLRPCNNLNSRFHFRITFNAGRCGEAVKLIKTIEGVTSLSIYLPK